MTSRQPDDKVLDHTRQQLSSLFDGELGLDEARFLQRRLEHDAALAAAWSRWQLAGDALRGQAVAAAPPGFAGRVAAAVAAEGAPARVASGNRRSRLLPGAALAASVAALAMFMTRQAPEVAPPPAPSVEVASAADTVPVQAPTPTPTAPAAPDTVPAGMLEAAGTAIAVAEVPRRSAERRSRAQQQRAAATRAQRTAAEPRLVAAAAAAPAAPAADTPANPFLPEAAAEAITTRPWPRALLPDNGAFTVGYGRLEQGIATPHPFQPRPVALPQVSPTPDPEDTD
ncbi:sigma-E factor negative regulatory protein [Cognatiluteimonas lumbrici]|uniref:sigma-E factor negative regulatory protein n=1 Tax=Cognatiluteimonas lumbrici TaxID=2559601 RepID=UPI00112C2815|nr:sigma-E factor negative regulatory protein [Luteimonas lumbrici]